MDLTRWPAYKNVMRNDAVPAKKNQKATLDRRRIIQLAAAAMGLWARGQLSATSLLEAGMAQDLPHPEPLLPLFPLDVVLLPHTTLPLHIFEERYKEMIQDCLENGWEFGMLAVEGRSVHSIGCTAFVSEVLERFPDGRLNILVRGRRRFEISQLNDEKSYLRGKPEFLDDDATESPAAEELRERAIQLYSRLLELAKWDNQSLQGPSPIITDMQLSYRLVAGLPASFDWKQSLLELRSERERLDQVIRYFEQLVQSLQRPGSPRQII
jgi:Lon protease-like protein